MSLVSERTETHSPVDGLARRWKTARLAALGGFVDGSSWESEDASLWIRVSPGRQSDALRRAFDHSATLGRGFRRYYRVELTQADLAAVLPVLGAPCHATGFVRAEGEPAWRCVGRPCAMAAVPGGCAYWRECVHGLVGGLTEQVRYTRLESPPTGGGCVDLLHVDPQTRLRFAPVPAEERAALDSVARLARSLDPGAKLAFLGLVEGALHYTLTPSDARQGCGGCGGLTVTQAVPQALRSHLSGRRVVDATPRPVFAESP